MSAPATRLRVIAETLGYRFNNPDLLLQACTHASWVPPQANPSQRRAQSNERLEFLGDAILDGAMAHLLYQHDTDADEGTLSQRKSRLVSRATLAEAFDRLQLAEICRVGGQVQEPWPESVKANLAEGILGGIFLDGGWDQVSEAVRRLLGDRVDAEPDASPADVKNRLQAIALANTSSLPSYATERCGGSDHQPEFRCVVAVGDQQASGIGGSRRRAEIAAAASLLAELEAGETDTETT